MKSGLRCIEPLEARIAPAFAAVFELSSIDGRNGFELSGEAAADFSGRSVSDAGDVNGDGFGDLIIGAPIASPNGSYSGASYVVFGKAGGFAADLNLSTLDGSNGFKLSGVAAFDESGRSVSDAGDVNGDSFDDLIIGAFGADPNGDGSRASYVVFGKASGFAANLNLSTLDGGNGFKLSGVAALNYSTGSVSGAGDVNGDGFGDLIIVTSGADPNGFYSGARYVVFGKASGFAADLNLSTLNGSNGFTLSGLVANETVPGSVSGAGDVNGDGFGDLIIGAPTADSNGTFSGASYVVFGKASGFAADLNLSSLNGTNGFKLSGVGANDVSGGSVSAAGDVNGDGFGDLIVGARGADPNGPGSGTSYVVFGKPSGFAADLNLATLIGPNGFKLNGGAAGDYSGGSVSAAGDVNGDGFGDLIIGADRASSNGRYSGASYVVFGKASGFAPNLKLSTLDGRNGFTLHGGAAYDRSGGSVSAAGDVNGDGFGDLIIGIGAQSGASYVVFGQGGSPLPSIAIGDATAAEGDAGTTPLIFPVILSFASAQTVTVQFSTVAGTAAAGRDYTAVVNQTLEFAPGETSKMIAVTVFGETVNEPDETVSINLSSATNVALSDRVGLGLILDNDSLELSSLDGSNGFKLSGVATYDLSGTAVSDAGDVNGDGFGDLIIGANRASPNGIGSGASYVVFGQVSGIAANLNLSALDGRNGFKLSGAAEYDYSGYSVSAAGDFNGDGFGDLIIGARGADPNGFDSGASYVVFGKASGFAADLNLSTLDGSNGFKLSGVAEGDRSGASVSAAGDVNGDGFGDLIIGADSADPNGYSSGASYVVFGKASGFAANLDLSTLDGRNGFTLNGVAAYDRSGGSVSAAGDVNGDGFGDLIIGAHGADPNGNYSGASYVVFGGASELGANLNLSALDGRNGFKLSGVAENRAGDSVSAAGDVNGDGFDDLIVGAYQAYSDSRASYVVFGQESGFAANLNLSTLDGSNGFKLSGSSGPVSDAGDVNGDGFDDLIIGAFSAYHYGSFSGASYVVFGQASGFAANLNLGTLDGGNGFRLSGGAAPDNSGASVSAAGDINGDGFDDLIIGAPVASPSGSYSGASYVVFGQGRPALPSVSIGDATAAEGDAGTSLVMFPVTLSFGSTQTVTVQFSTVDGTATAGRDYTAVVNQTLEFAPGETIKMIAATVLGDTVVEPDETFFGNLSSVTNAALATPHGLGLIPDDDSLELSSLEGSNGFKLSGVAANDGSGGSVSAAGDVNGDGFGDLIIGAQRAGPNGDVSGASYVVFGKASAFSADLNLSGLDGSNGFKLSGVAAYDYSGSSVSAAGDVNGDGFDDLIIGASRAYANGRNSGASYVVFGKASGFGADLNLSALDGSNGFKLSGVAAYDSSGGSVSAAGDVNGDGFGDLIIGARGADPNGYNSGASYVVFGNGSAFSADLNLSALDGSNGFKLSGVAANDYSGSSVSAAGDVNGDGFDDLIIGAYGADPNRTNSGASYVVFGKASGFAANLNLSALDGSNGFKLSGVAADDRSGGWVSAAGDVNGDGYGELIIGARGADPNGSRSGASYVVFGKASGFAANLNLSTLDGSNGFTLNGVARDSAGGSVSAAGDVNGDGFGDLIIGALGASPNGTYSGASYVVFGKSNAFAVDFNLSTLDGRNGFTLNGVAEGDNSGESVSAAGDVNGDGFGDLIIGARLADPNGSRSGASYVVFGQGGAALPSVSIGDAMAAEGEAGTSPLMFPVTLSFASTQTVTVQFSTVDGTASVGSDYTVLVNQTLQFAPGETTRMITVNLLGDTTVESDENLSVVFSSATKATITDGTGVGTILNDEVPAVSIGDAALAEGDSGTTTLAFAVTLSRSSLSTVSVRVSTVDGAATAGTDFTALNSFLVTFAPGETSKLVTVVSLSDAIAEADETFSVLLSGATNATIANGTGTGTILNDDAPTRPRVQITDASVLEGHSGPRALTFTVSLSAETTLPVSVNFASAAGTSPAGTDYAALTPGILTFAPGETMKTITVDVLGDIVVEPSEMFSVLLSEAVNADIEDGTGLGTILDDDVTLLGKRGVTFTDVDGERVTIKVSKGTLKVEDFTIVPSGSGAQLALVDFSGETEFAGVNLSITAKRAAGTAGNRLVDVGAINASGIDLGNVVIKGDLGQIDAGDDRDPRPGLLSLRADSLGRRGLDTQLPGGSLQSDIAGAFKTLNLARGVQDAALSVSGDIGAVTIKGSLLGSAIRSDGKIGALKISGDLAASATSTATISARGATTVSDALAFGKITIGGSVEHAQILAGYDRFGAAANVDASIGLVSVGRNWIASDLVAGAIAGTDAFFGTDDDALVSRGHPLIAKIASIVIKGTVSGTEGGTDHFGFVAEQIAAFSSDGARIALTPGPSNDIAGASVSPSGNVKVREAA